MKFQLLNEMATVYRNDKYNIMVSVNPDRKHIGERYFKFYNSTRYESADKVIRISFDSPTYIFHQNLDNKEDWILNSRERKELCEILTTESTKYSNCTNWDASKFDWNNECMDEQLNLDKYLLGEYDSKYIEDKRFVPSNLSMPDYTKIKY